MVELFSVIFGVIIHMVFDTILWDYDACMTAQDSNVKIVIASFQYAIGIKALNQ